MKYKLVIFDFDGTLADSFPWVVGIADHVTEKYQYRKIETSDIDSYRAYGAKEMIKRTGVPIWRLVPVVRYVRRLMTENIDQITLFEGIDQVLQRLSKEGVALAVVTSNSCENVRKVLGAEIAGKIQYYECGVSLFGKAPKFRRIVRKSGVKPMDILCIGDEIRDIEAAKKVRIPSGAVAWGYTDIETLEALRPDEVFASVEEIFEKIA